MSLWQILPELTIRFISKHHQCYQLAHPVQLQNPIEVSPQEIASSFLVEVMIFLLVARAWALLHGDNRRLLYKAGYGFRL